MSRDASVQLYWPDPDEPMTFRLRLKHLRELQELCGERGPERLIQDLQTGDWRVDDIVQTIRLGCIGGGMSEADAQRFVNKHAAPGALGEAKIPAIAILLAAISQPKGDEVDAGGGKDNPMGKSETTEAGTASVTSTEQEPPSGSAPATSTN